MKILRREKEGVAILDLEGNIDINSSDFIEAIGFTLLNKSKNIVCNMQGVNIVDYIGISVLAIAYKNVLNHKGNIKFYNIPLHVKKLFSIVGLNRVLECYVTEQQAINSFVEDAAINKILKKKLRRRFERIPFNSPVEYKLKFSRQDVFHRGKIINLSAVGAFVVGEKVFSVGEIMLTKLHLLPRPGIVEVETKVTWVSKGNINPLEYPAMGIEFYNITSQQQRKIMVFVDRNLAGKGYK